MERGHTSSIVCFHVTLSYFQEYVEFGCRLFKIEFNAMQ